MLLVAGNGRNVGKTYFACSVIKHLSRHTVVTGIKISSHIHSYNPEDVLFKNEHFVIIQEKEITNKDSSLMLQSGAQKVFFIMAEQEYLYDAFSYLQTILPDNAIVCESGGLYKLVNPGLFFFIKRKDSEIVKTEHLSHSPVIIENDGNDFNFDINSIHFSNRRIYLNHE